MAISNDMIKTLRDRTGAGMMDCKKALEATSGDMEAAIEYLRKKGAAVAQKRADRAAKEGMIITRVSTDGTIGVILEVNSETDFVGRSEDFVGFAQAVADVVMREKPRSLDELHGKVAGGGRKISELLNDLLAKVGEKVGIRRFSVFESPAGTIFSYTHLGNKIGVLVEITGTSATGPGRDIAMQIAAMNPMVVSRDQVDPKTIEREQDIYRTQAANEGKPAQVLERIVAGKLEKFYQEVCLLEQTFIKDPAKTVKEYLQSAGKDAAVKQFTRFHLGEDVSTH